MEASGTKIGREIVGPGALVSEVARSTRCGSFFAALFRLQHFEFEAIDLIDVLQSAMPRGENISILLV